MIRRTRIRPPKMPLNAIMDIPNTVVSSSDPACLGSGQPSSYPSTPLASSGQLSSKSLTPSPSVSFSLFEHPSSSTFEVGEFGHLSGTKASETNSPGQSESRELFQSGLPQLSPYPSPSESFHCVASPGNLSRPQLSAHPSPSSRQPISRESKYEVPNCSGQKSALLPFRLSPKPSPS